MRCGWLKMSRTFLTLLVFLTSLVWYKMKKVLKFSFLILSYFTYPLCQLVLFVRINTSSAICWIDRSVPVFTSQIRYASLERLLERLLDLRFLSIDFLNTFLITYRVFSSSESLLDTLRNFHLNSSTIPTTPTGEVFSPTSRKARSVSLPTASLSTQQASDHRRTGPWVRFLFLSFFAALLRSCLAAEIIFYLAAHNKCLQRLLCYNSLPFCLPVDRSTSATAHDCKSGFFFK